MDSSERKTWLALFGVLAVLVGLCVLGLWVHLVADIMAAYVIIGVVIGVTDVLWDMRRSRDEVEQALGKKLDIMDIALWFSLSSLFWPLVTWRWVAE